MKIFSNKIFSFIIIAIVLISLNSCWSREYDYWYRIDFKNETLDLLLIKMGTSGRLDTIPIGESIQEYGSVHIDKGDSPVKDGLFPTGNNRFLNKIMIYRNDSLLITWEGPAQNLPDSIHSPFNYNSWNYWLIDDNDGIIQFTITDEDFK